MGFSADYRSTYSFKDHYFLFISLVYGVILVKFFDCWKSEFIVCFEQAVQFKLPIFSSAFWQHPKIIPFYLSLCFMSYVIESWWASQIDSKHIVRFFKFFIGIMHPIILFLFFSILCDENFKSGTDLVKKAVCFNFILLFSWLYVLFLRTKFHGRKKFLNNSANFFRFGGIGLAILSLMYWYLWSDMFFKNHYEIVLFFNGGVFLVGIYFFIKRERNYDELVDNINADQFIEDIISKAKMTERNSQYCGIVLIELRNTSANLVKRKIIDQFRKDVEASISQDNFVQMFIPCIDDTKAVEAKLTTFKNENSKIKIVQSFRNLSFISYTSKERKNKKNELEKTLRFMYDDLCKKLRK